MRKAETESCFSTPCAKPRSRWLLLAAVAIAAILGGVHYFGLNGVLSMQSKVIMYMAANSAQTSTNVTLGAMVEQVERLGGFISSAPEVRDLFSAARRALDEYGAESPQVAAVRAELLEVVRRQFIDKMPELAQVHLAFHLADTPSLFLQINAIDAPKGTGSASDTLARQAILAQKPVRGFVTDAAYAGLRCAVPVLITEHSDAMPHSMGAVEIGVDFEGFVFRLVEYALADKRQTGDFAALLKKDIADKAFSPVRLAGLRQILLANAAYYVLADTSITPAILKMPQVFEKLSPVKDITGRIHKELVPELTPRHAINWLKDHLPFLCPETSDSVAAVVDGVPMGFVAFLLDSETFGSADPALGISKTLPHAADEAVVLSWASFPEIVRIYEHQVKKTLVHSLISYILVLAVLYVTWRFANRKLRQLVELRTSELAAAEQRYRGFYENAVQGMFQSRAEGRYSSVNPAYAAMLGYTQDELFAIEDIGATLYDDPKQRSVLLEKLQHGGVVRNFELDMKRKDGSIVHALLNVRAGADDATAFEGIAVDNTARKLAEERLKKSEETYRRIIETASEGFLLMDMDFRILDVNDSYVRLLGYERNELLGRQPLELATKETRAFINKNLAQLRAAAYRSFEGAYQAKDGREVPVQVNSNALHNDQGQVIGQVAFVSDISERKKADALREDVERMARHDLKTPLNAVINLPQIMLMSDNLDQDQIDYLNMIQDAGYRMLDMVNLSLNLYKMEQRTYQFAPRRVDLLPLLRRVVLDLNALSEAKSVPIEIRVEGVAVEKKTSGALSCMIQGEELLCYSMFANLVKNAVEATPDGGEAVAIDCTSNGRPHVAVHNQGAIPEEIRGKFFEKYATAGKSDGTGLGTYSAWLIAQTHHAEITVASSELEGTTVAVAFPPLS